jgi:hypothetical protein
MAGEMDRPAIAQEGRAGQQFRHHVGHARRRQQAEIRHGDVEAGGAERGCHEAGIVARVHPPGAAMDVQVQPAPLAARPVEIQRMRPVGQRVGAQLGACRRGIRLVAREPIRRVGAPGALVIGAVERGLVVVEPDLRGILHGARLPAGARAVKNGVAMHGA